MTKHPATFSDSIIEAIRRILDVHYRWPLGSIEFIRVFDPFSGMGKIREVYGEDAESRPRFYLNELEPEWAIAGGASTIGNTLCLPYKDEVFDCVATSPVFGNRMSDHHDAKDSSRRITYRHVLGRPLHPANSGQLQWGVHYRGFHVRAWKECVRVLSPGGLFILNVSDHIRQGKRMRVVAWHKRTLKGLGLESVGQNNIRTPRMRFGQNAKARVRSEVVAVFRKPVWMDSDG